MEEMKEMNPMDKITVDKLVLIIGDEEIKITLPYSFEVYRGDYDRGNDLIILYQIVADLMNKVKVLEDKIKDLK